ncbi:hypothetical protein [Sphingomonas sp.]|uniref:hypothetical protein n=1 Tax=Sphingomonas sp. TaxID=28214 RepID=UPI00286A315C|nr:hypothetical protein [Sphingomonas sp.]
MNNWKNIRLELAQSPEFPTGSVSRAYLLRLPLDDNDLVDEGALLNSPRLATVRRHWANDPDEAGLVQKVNGALAMSSNGASARMLRLDDQPIRLGQQVSVVESDGAVLAFRIASIR